VTTLNTEANLSAPDDFYQELIDAHRDLTEAQSALLNATTSAISRCCARRSPRHAKTWAR
jgi:hypothetical protein